jgi:hypothetical protein
MGGGEAGEPVLAWGSWLRWGVVGILSAGIIVAGAASGPLLYGLAHVAHAELPADPALPAVLRYLPTASAMWGVGVLAVAAWIMRWPLPWLMPSPYRGRRPSLTASQGSSASPSPSQGGEDEGGRSAQLPDLEATLVRTAQTLRSTVEAGALERAISEVDRVVLGTAYLTHRAVEQRFLEDAIYRLARGTARGARSMYHIVEQQGLEGLLRAAVRATFGLARLVQGWHTGRLRRNLLWIAICLALAMWFVFAGW